MDEDINTHFGDKPAVYIGFDPTAESIHIGNFLGLVALTHFRIAGFQPIVLFGGATGLIGDPSGRDSERQLMTNETVETNIANFQKQFSALSTNIESRLASHNITSPLEPVIYVNNNDFYKGMSVIDFLRDIGKHYRLGTMLSKESVKSRIGDALNEGMSFTEFSYQIFQGYDFLRLRQLYNCQV